MQRHCCRIADGVNLDGGEAECTAREECVGLPGSCCSAMNGTILERGKDCCSGCWVRKSRLNDIDSVCASLDTECTARSAKVEPSPTEAFTRLQRARL